MVNLLHSFFFFLTLTSNNTSVYSFPSLSFGSNFQVSNTITISFSDGSQQNGTFFLHWSASLNAWRADSIWGDSSQTQITTLVTYSSDIAYIYSINNSICSSYCLPFGVGGSLPILGIQSTDNLGTTSYSGNNIWTRVQKGGVSLNSTVTYEVDPDDYDTPVLKRTHALYSVPGSSQVVATLTCQANLATYKEDVGPPDPLQFR